jgi:hypothetical protein
MESLLGKFWCERASDATHLSLVGGKFRITQLDLFHKMYFRMVSSMEAHLVEKVRFPCRWYIDLDKQSEILENLRTILVHHGERCIVSMPDSHDGVHIVFPDILVASKADAIRRTTQLFRNTDIVFDTSVYASGLRMLGSRKSKTVDRVYMPVYEVQHGEWRASEWSLRTLCESSIMANTERKSENPKAELQVVCEKTQDFSETTLCQGDFSFLHDRYKNIRYQAKRYNKDYINVMTDSRYCINIGREHKSNRVYFVVYANPKTRVITVYSKCFCQCEHTGCANYKSPEKRMPLLLYFKLKTLVD